MSLLLGLGAALAALTYLGATAARARSRWETYRAEAEWEDAKAGAEAMNASHAGVVIEQLTREGRTTEAERWARFFEGHLQNESMHRGKARELRERWW